MSFDQLGLAPELLRAVADQGYLVPTPVQAEAIPLVLAGRDVLAGAQTGTGKTAAFVLPILERLNASRPAGEPSAPRGRPARGPVRVLVLAPTRELAIQVEESVRTYGAHRPVGSTSIYGGVGFDPQVRALRAGPEIVVATPGRLLDHVGQGTIDLGRVEVLVLDEADRMLDMGFARDIRRILALLPERRQNLLFSATFSDDIRRFADGLLDRPASVQVTPRNAPAAMVRQVVHPVDRERKRELLSHLVRSGRIYQALVFTRTKHGADRLAEQLGRDGISAAAIHGNKSQPQRLRALAAFKANRVAVLVATDVAARGIDIEALPHVVNYELPMVPQDYVHRIGRTGRAGLVGEAISLVCVDEGSLLREIEGVLGRRIPSEVVGGYEPDRTIRPEPIRLRSGMVPPARGGRPLHVARHVGRPGPAMRPGGAPPDAGRSDPARDGYAPGLRPAERDRRPAAVPAPIGRYGPAAAWPARPAGRPGPRPGTRPTPRAEWAPRPFRAAVSRPDGGRAPGAFDTMPGERIARNGGRPFEGHPRD